MKKQSVKKGETPNVYELKKIFDFIIKNFNILTYFFKTFFWGGPEKGGVDKSLLLRSLNQCTCEE